MAEPGQMEDGLQSLCINLHSSSDELQLALQAVKEGCINLARLPLEGCSTGLQAALQEGADSFLKQLVVYSKCLAPITRASLENLVYFLDTYMDADFQHFMDMLPMLQDELPRFAGQAFGMRGMYEDYVVELERVSQEVDDVMKKYEYDLQLVVKKIENKLLKSKVVQVLSVGAGVLSVGGAIALCCLLMGPGGLLAAPNLLGLTVAAGAAGVRASSSAYDAAESSKFKAQRMQVHVNQTGVVRDQLSSGLPSAIAGMQEIARTSAEFFDQLKTKLDTLDRQANTTGAVQKRQNAEKQLRCLFNSMQRQMGRIKMGCNSYLKVAGELRMMLMNDDIQSLCQDHQGAAQEWLEKKVQQGKVDRAMLNGISDS